jgi:hypothetical protein
VLEVGAELEGKQSTVLVKVLHAVLCLKSRFVNMLHPSVGRKDAIARAQAEAAVIVVQPYIHDALDERDHPRYAALPLHAVTNFRE